VKRRILLIAGNFYPEPTGIGKYNGEMVKWLARQGYSCTVIATYPYYPQWRVQKPYEKRSFWFKKEEIAVQSSPSIKVIRCPHFVPKNPTGIKRLISDASFFFSAYLVISCLLFSKKFDSVITVAPPFTLGLLGILYEKIRGSKLIYHIQDLQIDAAKDLGMIRSASVINMLFAIEKLILKKADFISTISTGMMNRVKKKCNKEIILFPNWVDVHHFFPINDKDRLKEDFGFNREDTIVLYSGAIGEKQGLEAIINSAKFFSSVSNLKFIICGSGPYKEKLQKMRDESKLHNVVFLPTQPTSRFNSFLNLADVHLVIQKANAGDLVMPSKLSTIFSVGGLSIVTAHKGTSLYNLIETHETGIVIKPECVDALNDAINFVLNNDCFKKQQNAREYALKHLSAESVLRKFSGKVLDFPVEERMTAVENI
jgi:colanic acid biosynthesis glycosyl transferase WcaI